jgi:hypothetical protein
MHACPSIVMNASALAATPGKTVEEKYVQFNTT